MNYKKQGLVVLLAGSLYSVPSLSQEATAPPIFEMLKQEMQDRVNDKNCRRDLPKLRGYLSDLNSVLDSRDAAVTKMHEAYQRGDLDSVDAHFFDMKKSISDYSTTFKSYQDLKRKNCQDNGHYIDWVLPIWERLSEKRESIIKKVAAFRNQVAADNRK